MIVLKLQGGLGNQMFEYAFGRSIQKETGRKLILDISDYKYDKLRDYSLNHFSLKSNIIVDNSGRYNAIYDQRINLLIKLAVKTVPNLLFNFLSRFGVYIWDSAEYKPILINKSKKKIYLHGYWQGYQYFNDIIEELREEFKVKDPVEGTNSILYDRICKSNSVCVHVRRGDFLLSTNKMYKCETNYYLAAMQKLEEKYRDLQYFIFSDDIVSVKKEIDFGDRKIIFVEQNNPDYEELRLMYSCKHFIIANSTFSWWAAILGTDKNKTVCAPKNWYTDGRIMSNLLRPEWEIIEN